MTSVDYSLQPHLCQRTAQKLIFPCSPALATETHLKKISKTRFTTGKDLTADTQEHKAKQHNTTHAPPPIGHRVDQTWHRLAWTTISSKKLQQSHTDGDREKYISLDYVLFWKFNSVKIVATTSPTRDCRLAKDRSTRIVSDITALSHTRWRRKVFRVFINTKTRSISRFRPLVIHTLNRHWRPPMSHVRTKIPIRNRTTIVNSNQFLTVERCRCEGSWYFDRHARV